MSTSDPTPPRSLSRDFLNRREPGALWTLAVLTLLALLEIVWVLSGYRPYLPHFSLILTLLALNHNERWTLPVAPTYSDPRWGIPVLARRWVWLMAAISAMLALWPRSEGLDRGLSSQEISRVPAGITNPATSASPHSLENWWRGLPDFEAGVHGGWSELESRMGWKLIGGGMEDPRPHNERALRIFPWISGLLTVGLVTLLATTMGSPRAGLAAGLILAMHPLHVRWSMEIGGLSTLLMSCTVMLLCLVQVFRTNRWRWWAGLGVTQTICMLCHGSAAFALLAMNVVAIILLKTSGASKRDRKSHVRRLYAAALLVLLPVLSVLFPLHSGQLGDVKSFWADLLCGLPFDSPGSGFGFDSIIGEAAWRGWMFWGLLPLVCLGGFIALLLQDWRTQLAGGTLGLATMLAWISAGPAQALPFALLLLPLTLAWSGVWLLRRFPGVPRMAHAPVIVAVAFVLTTTPALQRVVTVPVSPLRELIATARTHADQTAQTTTATFGDGFPAARVADPSVVHIDRLKNLLNLIDIAYEQNRPLYIYHSLAPNTLRDWPYTLRELQTSGRFHLIQEFPASDPHDTIRLYRYQPREQIIRLNVTPEKK